MKQIIVPGKIVTNNPEGVILTNHYVEIEGNKITAIKPYSKEAIDGEVVFVPHLTMIPGFVQTHIHLCQTLFRGLADDLQLLDWLQLKIFPFENGHDKNSLRVSAQLGINELFLGGTTTLLDMGTLRHQEVIFDEIISSGIRAFAGKCMIDENDLFPDLKNSTADELQYTYELAKQFHNSAGGRVNYGFAPRFVLSCSEKLLRETKEIMKDFPGTIFHTHSSENRSEIEEVRRRHNKENIIYFNSIDCLDDHAVLAHCIHVNEDEISLLKKTKTRVAHCPSSNLKLGSGIARIPELLDKGVHVSIGADGAPCNNNLSAFIEMRLAALIQKPIYGASVMDAKTVFRLATIEGAKALHLEDKVGSIEVGKLADIVLLDLNNPSFPFNSNDESIYSTIVYSADANAVSDVMVDGKWVVRNKSSLIFEKESLISKGKTELQKLLKRIN
jgi:5-methylthioadenosine/S-adenosylhomocysteine deaminase